MNARNLRWTMVSIAAVIAIVMWWSLRSPQHTTSIAEPSTLAPASLPAPRSDLDADPLALVRAPAQVVAQPVQVATANTQSGIEHHGLSILVIDRATRVPLPGMGVQLSSGPLAQYVYSNSMRETSDIVLTDAQGRAAVDASYFSRNSSLFAWDPAGLAGSARHDLEEVEIALGGDIVLELSPDNDFVLWMRVVDEDTNAPVAGAHDVVPIDMHLPSKSPFPSYMSFRPEGGPLGESDANGLLLISGPAWTAHQIELVSPDHSTVYVNPEKGHGRADKPMVVTTPPTASLHIHVVDTAGLPVSGCKIWLSANSNQQERPRPEKEDVGPRTDWQGFTDASGYALVTNITPHVLVESRTEGVANWRKTKPLTLEPGERREVEWVAAGGATLRGTLYDKAGTPIPDCDVWLMRTYNERPGYFDETCRADRDARTDASGRFVFASAEAGRFWVGPGYPTIYPTSVRKDIAPFASVVDVARDDLDVELHSAVGLYVRGRVIPPADKPLLEGTVTVEDRARKLSVSAKWAEDGSFSIGPLMDGPLTVFARSSSGHAPSESIDVEAGADDVKLDMRAGATIAGRVVSVDESPSWRTILLTPHGAGPSVASTFSQSSDGEFSFAGLADGAYDIAAFNRYRGMTLAVMSGVQVTAGGTVKDLVLQLEPAGEVRFRNLDFRWKGELQVEANGVRIAAQPLTSQDSYLLPASAGRVTVRRWNSETHEPIERVVDIVVGKRVDVTFTEDRR